MRAKPTPSQPGPCSARAGCYPRGVPNRLACRRLTGAVAGLVLCLAPRLAGGATNSLWFARSWQSDEGLPNNTISGLAQTPDGYLWLGTPSGLVRFDGIRFEDFSPTNFVAPPNRGAIAMLLGRNGALWLAMDRGGVVRLQAGASREFTAGLPTAIPNGLAEDAEGTLWIAYRGGTVYRLKDGQASACAAQAGLPGGADICALCTDNQRRIWFAKAGECGIVREGSFPTLHRFDPQPARLAAARGGGVWLCAGSRLFKSGEQGELQDCGEFKAERANPIATALLEDHEGAVWIGTSFSGLFRHDESGFESIETTHQEILSLAEDREGNLWVGTAGGGVNRVRRRAVALEGARGGLAVCRRAVHLPGRGRQYLGRHAGWVGGPARQRRVAALACQRRLDGGCDLCGGGCAGGFVDWNTAAWPFLLARREVRLVGGPGTTARADAAHAAGQPGG